MKIIITLGAPLNLDCTPSHHLLTRLKQTRKEYQTGDIVIVTGARCQKLALSEAKVMHNWLLSYDIPSLTEERAMNTIQNGMYTRKFVDSLCVDKNTEIMIITSDFHLPRTTLIFLYYFNGYKVRFVQAQTTHVDELNRKEASLLVQMVQNFPPPTYTKPSLIQEVKAGYFSGVQLCIEELNNRDSIQNTALHWAASYGFTEICAFLLEQGADINTENKNKCTPLHYAVIFGRLETIALLLERGASTQIKAFNQRWKGQLTPLQALSFLRVKLDVEKYTISLLLLVKFDSESHNVWIRHAETEHNYHMQHGSKIRGLFDTKLTRTGHDLVQRLNYWVCRFNLLDGFEVYCSPLQRTLQTCQGFLHGTSFVPKISACIRERLGDESSIGKPTEELEKEYPKYDFTKVPRLWWYKPEQNNKKSLSQDLTKLKIENWEELRNRITKFRQTLPIKKQIFFTHSNVIFCLSNHTLRVRNCDAVII